MSNPCCAPPACPPVQGTTTSYFGASEKLMINQILGILRVLVGRTTSWDREVFGLVEGVDGVRVMGHSPADICLAMVQLAVEQVGDYDLVIQINEAGGGQLFVAPFTWSPGAGSVVQLSGEITEGFLNQWHAGGTKWTVSVTPNPTGPYDNEWLGLEVSFIGFQRVPGDIYPDQGDGTGGAIGTEGSVPIGTED